MIFLPIDQVVVILQDKKRNNYIIGVNYDWSSRLITFITGDLKTIRYGRYTWPNADISNIEIIDHGHAVKFGTWEICADVIIPNYDYGEKI